MQQDEKRLAPDAGKAVAARHGAHAIVNDGYIIPIGEVVADGIGAFGIVLLHAAQGIVGQNHAPAEGVIGLVAFQNRHLMGGIPQLHGNGKIDSGRTAPETENLHGNISRSRRIERQLQNEAVLKLFQA